MTPRLQPEPRPTASRAGTRPRRWLLFVHQLPSTPSNLRVSTWRRLQQLGAIPLKQAVYLLPDTPSTREDLEWLKTEVKGAGGDASVFAADSVDAWSDDVLVEEFKRSRQDAYAALARDVEHALKRAGSIRRREGKRAPAIRRLLDIFRERLTAIDGIDFFGSAGRDRVIALVEKLEARSSDVRRAKAPSPTVSAGGSASYHGRLWVTRPRPGVDRMASAWLIQRFIDLRARFGFVADRYAVPEHAVPFDMFGVDFTHQGGGCTFETLCASFAVDAPAIARVAAIVHDLDLKDGRFGAPEGHAIAAVIEGLQLAHQDDDALLAQGVALFDALYRSFDRSMRSTGPRALARPNKDARSHRTRRSRKAR